MPDIFLELFSDTFLLKHALWAVLLLSAIAPLAGCFLLLRRATFLGVALPQVSAAGMSAGWLLLEANGRCSAVAAATRQGGGVNALLSLLCAFAATLGALGLLAWLERRGHGATDSRHGALYALAGAATVLLLNFNSHAENAFANLFRGEIVSVGLDECRLVAVVLVPAAVVLTLFRNEFLWAGADPDFMAATGRSVWGRNIVLLGLVGAIISAAVYVAGPLVCLGAVLLPALSAHCVARRIGVFFVLAPVFGVLGALAGFVFAFDLDLPTGATILAAHGVILVLAKLAAGIRRLIRRVVRS
jgi:ABC-type Mn2+/Zn2+ transport system permease subunit